MNTNPTAASALRSVTRAAALVACLALTACGSSQNWKDKSGFVTIGGTVTGLTGTVVLQNNGQDDLTLTANGKFTFALSIARGADYDVRIQNASKQPIGQFCTVTNGAGTATTNVATVAVVCKSDVTIGGTVSGLVGTVVLQNNDGNPLATASNGTFTFTSPIRNGTTYSVTVRTQPTGLTCSVTNGFGTATANVTNVAVTCEVFTLRPLDAVYYTGKSVNYSAFRAGGPGVGEIPSDADVLQDLGLLHTAGFNLLRLFGADDVSDKILRLAQVNFPEMRFQQGIALAGIPVAAAASCQDPAGFNDTQISRAIALANQYKDIVVAVAVGNETSFFSKYMPTACLASYITRVRGSVTQPVTTEDDWTFFADKTSAGTDKVVVHPQTILPIIDFVAIHTYPILNDGGWDWKQTGVPAGQARAAAMMNASLERAQFTYAEVANLDYVNAAGVTVTTGNSLPITIGETGWKAVQTNPASAIEKDAANPVNEKWYYDLMNSWRGAPGGPVTIFFFEAFDESWKGIDDGWGLWDKTRAARYALCGTPAGPACNADLYAGAGYYGATSGGGGGGSAFSPISFDSASVTYTLTGFGGAEDSTVVTDPAGGANKVAKVVKSAAAQSWAGTTVSTGANSSVGKIAFDAANTRMTVRVYSPNAGIKVRLKVEDAADPAHSVETEATTATSNAWETLTFDFATPVTGTPALNFTYTYDKVTIFFNFGVDGATAGAKTYYFDDVTFIGGTGGGGGGGGFVNGIFADDYVGDLPATAKSTQGGDVGFFFDPRLAVNVGATYDYAGVSGTAQDPQGVHNFYYGLGLNAPAIIDAYFGAYIKSPGNGTVDVSGFANIKVNVWGPDQLFKPGTFPALNVILQGPAVAGCGSASGGSEVETTFNTTGQGADKIYTLLLSGFTLKSACSGETTVAQVLASIAQINIVLKNANIQYVNKDPGGVAFTNGLNVGSIKFE